MGDTQAKRPNVFVAQNYRDFLREFYFYEKQTTTAFSYRVFSARAGFKSPNFLKLVIDGKRNLTLASIRGIIKALKLTPDEGTFFKNLVLLNQAKTAGEKGEHVREMFKSKVFRELYPMKKAELEFYQNWYCIPIREMIGSPGFQDDPKWIASRLRPLAPVQKVVDAIEIMLQLGLIRRDENGKLRQCQKNLTTGDEVQSTAVAEFHKQMIHLAANSIDEVNRMQRDVSSSTILISETTLHRLKEMVRGFRKAILAEAEQGGAGKQAVYQINFQVFPLSEFIAVADETEEEVPCKSAA